MGNTNVIAVNKILVDHAAITAAEKDWDSACSLKKMAILKELHEMIGKDFERMLGEGCWKTEEELSKESFQNLPRTLRGSFVIALSFDHHVTFFDNGLFTRSHVVRGLWEKHVRSSHRPTNEASTESIEIEATGPWSDAYTAAVSAWTRLTPKERLSLILQMTEFRVPDGRPTDQFDWWILYHPVLLANAPDLRFVKQEFLDDLYFCQVVINPGALPTIEAFGFEPGLLAIREELAKARTVKDYETIIGHISDIRVARALVRHLRCATKLYIDEKYAVGQALLDLIRLLSEQNAGQLVSLELECKEVMMSGMRAQVPKPERVEAV